MKSTFVTGSWACGGGLHMKNLKFFDVVLPISLWMLSDLLWRTIMKPQMKMADRTCFWAFGGHIIGGNSGSIGVLLSLFIWTVPLLSWEADINSFSWETTKILVAGAPGVLSCI